MSELINEINKLTFEEAYKQLEEVVAQLENEENDLNDVIELFEKGKLLAKHCQALLEKAKLKVSTLENETTSPTHSE